MTTLLFRLAGPMQSWGTQSRFTVRETGLEPSKSGVIGLLCAALGKPRAERPGDPWPALEQLSRLKMGVRVDREGSVQMDYHTVGGTHRRGDHYGVAMVDGKPPRTIESRRYYLADADFLVGLEGDPDLLRQLDGALAQPVWSLYLGRKAFVPSIFIRLPNDPPRGPGFRDGSLEEVLGSYPWFRDGNRSREEEPTQLRLALEADVATGEEVRRDVPLSFAPDRRQFALRHVTTRWIQLRTQVPVMEA